MEEKAKVGSHQPEVYPVQIAVSSKPDSWETFYVLTNNGKIYAYSEPPEGSGQSDGWWEIQGPWVCGPNTPKGEWKLFLTRPAGADKSSEDPVTRGE